MLPLFEMAYIHLKVNFKKKIEEDGKCHSYKMYEWQKKIT